jgi:hypothetical protein
MYVTKKISSGYYRVSAKANAEIRDTVLVELVSKDDGFTSKFFARIQDTPLIG